MTTSLNDILAQHGFQKDMSDMLDSDPGALQTPSPAAPVLRSPDAASVQSQPKVSPPSAGSLPMRRAKPEGGNSEGALGPEKLAELKKEVSEAKKDSKLQRKASKVTIDKGFVPEKPKVTPDEPSQAFLKRRAESTAARKYLDSLATGANPGAVSSQKKPAANTNKTRKAKAKAKARSKASASKKVKSTINKGAPAKSGPAAAKEDDEEVLDLVEDDHEDGEEENGGESDDSQETLVLPGKGDDVGGPQNTPVAPDATNSEPTQNMRELYWKVVHEAQTRIRKANPKMKGAEVLKLARQEWNNHPERLNIIKNMSKEDLSKRRLMPDASRKTRVKKTPS